MDSRGYEMKTDFIDLFETEQKAIDHALWLNFKYRIAKIRFGVIHGPDNNWAVCEEATAEEMEMSFLDILPADHSDMTFKQIRHIKMDREPLPHWEEIMGTFSVLNGEILRYMLHADIPLKKIIRQELAARGFDKNHRWCGFEQAEKIWIGDEE